MRSSDVSIIGKITLAYFLINSSLLFCGYFFDWEILHKWYVNLFVLALSLCVVALLFRQLTVYDEYSPEKPFQLLTITIAVCFLSSSLTFLFLHHYLDTDHKYTVADRQVEKRIDKIREIEREKNVTMEFDEQKEREDVLKNYRLKQVIINYILSLPFAFLFAWLILSIISPPDPSE